MSLLRYFAYGSNLDRDQMRERCPSSAPRFRARLPDHRIEFTHYSTRWRGGAADLVPESGESVWGVVYELAPADLPRLDGFEAGYERVQLTVCDDRGLPHAVLSYSVREKGRHPPSHFYLDRILRCAAEWSFPPEYQDRLRSFKS